MTDGTSSDLPPGKTQAPGFGLPEEAYEQVLCLAHCYKREAEKCHLCKAFLAGCVMLGSALEALLLAFAACYPDEASGSPVAPRKGQHTKPLLDWTLAELLAVAKERRWLPSGLSLDDEWDDARARVGDYAEVVREIRNLVHPSRYARDLPSERLTARYLESSFEILDAVAGSLLSKIVGDLDGEVRE